MPLSNCALLSFKFSSKEYCAAKPFSLYGKTVMTNFLVVVTLPFVMVAVNVASLLAAPASGRVMAPVAEMTSESEVFHVIVV